MSTQETQTGNNNILFAVIIVLLIIIAILAFFVGKNLGSSSTPSAPAVVTNNGEDVVVTVIDDKRCTNCGTAEIANQIKQVPFLALADFVEKDFSDEWVEAYIKENEITVLPAIVFSTNQIGDGGTMTPYMKPLPGGEYSLEIGSTFDPYEERSDKWFLVLDSETLESIRSSSYFIGNPDAKITWIEYTDLGCHFCQKLHEEWTVKTVMAQFPDTLNKASNHYISVGGATSRKAAEILECVWELAGWNAFNWVFDQLFINNDYSEDFVKSEAEKFGITPTQIDTCLDSGSASSKVQAQMDTGNGKFGITGTPGNVIINNETGEYEVVPGAYPAETFSQTITSLLN